MLTVKLLIITSGWGWF